jgi:hypothetical protein
LSKRILDYDPFSGITTTFDYIPETETTVIHREQDVSHILDINKAMQNETAAWTQGVKNGWAHYAQIPNIVQEIWLNKHGVDCMKKENWEKGGSVWKLLNDPEYRYLKTTTKYHAG